ncbi:MAG: (Fe-S)-binding protein [Actinomycetota bacterium]
MKFHIDDAELAACVSCGLCLPHCPTFRVTGEEALSPRGRIAAIRSVHNDDAPVTAEFVSFMETCVQCRGCEPACPSGVPYGHVQEGVRETLAQRRRITPRWQRLAFGVLPHHRLLLAGSTALAVAQRLHLVPKRMGLPKLALRRSPPLRTTGTATGEDVWLFTGCVMDAWLRETHHHTATVLAHMGFGFLVPRKGGACCGAMHTHAGLTISSLRLAEGVIASMPGDAPIVVNSAGCGAAMQEYGRLLGTVEAQRFCERVIDVHEFVARHIDRLHPTKHLGSVIVQDPCHLRNVQRTHMAVRTVLAPVAHLVDTDDDGLCCGAGGAYSALEPMLAGQIRDRKVAALDRARSGTVGDAPVASANPGCAIHLSAAGVTVKHPMDLLAAAL